MRAAIYARLSSKSDDEENIPQQLAHGHGVIERRGWTFVEAYADDGVSAWREGVVRPDFQRMLHDARLGTFDVIVVRDIDRLTRSVADWGDLSRTGVQIATHGGELLDRFAVTILAGVASRESDMKAERQRLAEQRRVAAGKPPRGGRHFGYHLGCCDGCESNTVREEEAAVLREVAHRWLEGETLRGLASEMNTRGFRTTRGNEWTNRALKKTLLSPRLAAIRVHRGEEHRGNWPAVFTRELHTRLRAADSGSSTRRAPQRYLLTGLLVCGRCGHTLNGKQHRGTRGGRRYACRACSRVGIAAAPVEAHLWNEALGRTWHRDRTAERRAQARLDEARRELKEKSESLVELEDAYWQLRKVPQETYYTQAAALRGRIGELEASLAQFEEAAQRASGFWTDLLALAEEHETAPVWRRRRVLEGAIDRVTVASVDGPAAGGTVDLGRLQITWAR